MRKAIFCFYFLILVSSLFSLDLVGTRWGPEKGGFGYYLRFNTEKDFEYAYNGEGGGEYIKGTYVHNDNVITLTIVEVFLLDKLSYLKGKTVKCMLEESNSLFSNYKLTAKDWFELWCITHKPKEGDKRTIDGKVAYVFVSRGEINNNARVREGPGLQYKYYLFNYSDESPYHNFSNLGERSSIPKGWSVLLFGHSENKTEIDGKEEYWYYCSFQTDVFTMQFGWIWGGLIDFKPSNK